MTKQKTTVEDRYQQVPLKSTNKVKNRSKKVYDRSIMWCDRSKYLYQSSKANMITRKQQLSLEKRLTDRHNQIST